MEAYFNELFENNKEEIVKFILENPGKFILILIGVILAIILMLAVYFFLAWICLKISRKIFSSIERRKGKSIHTQFAENLVKLAIIIIFIVIPLGGDKIGQSLLGSAAVLAGVVGFAAQDVIKDILAGIQISIYKPFDLGDRIELENGTAGVVHRITMRHVEIRLIDTVVLIIPNSTINAKTINKAKQIISDAIEESPYSFPGKKGQNGEMIYGPVYFMAIDDSSLAMNVTVYYKTETPTEVLKDDINTRVFEALGDAGIDIPYPYTTVVMQKD